MDSVGTVTKAWRRSGGIARLRRGAHVSLGSVAGCHSGGLPIRLITSEDAMRGILLWLLGIPIPIIIALYLFDVI